MRHGEWIQPALIVCSALVGLGLGTFTGAGGSASALIEPFLMAMLFFVFLSVDMKQLRSSFSNRRFAASAVFINFVWTPLFAVLLGYAFFAQSADIRAGLLMLLIAPCTDWYLVFTSISKGDVSLSSSILPLNLVLQMIILPLFPYLLLGSGGSFDPASTVTSLLTVLIVPLALAMVVKFAAGRYRSAEKAQKSLMAKNDDFQVLFLCLAVVAMFASEGAVLMDNLGVLVLLLAPLLIFFGTNCLISVIVSSKMRFPYDAGTSLIFTTMARNSPLALAIAAAVFPDRPLLLLVLVIGPLIELPILSLAAHLRLRRRRAADCGT